MENYKIYFLSLLVCIASCSSEPDAPYKELSAQAKKHLSQDLLKIGEEKYAQGSPDNMNIIELSLRVDSANSFAWRELSVPYLKRGLPGKWKPLFDRAVDLEPVAWQGWRGYLLLYFYRDYASALRDFHATDSLTPTLTDRPQGISVNLLRGIAYLGLKNYAKAEEFISKSIREDSASLGENWVDSNSYIYQGVVKERLGKIKSAKAAYHKNVKYNSNSSDGYFHLAKIHLELGELDSAVNRIALARTLYTRGLYLRNPYVEVLEQIYLEDIDELEAKINKVSPSSQHQK